MKNGGSTTQHPDHAPIQHRSGHSHWIAGRHHCGRGQNNKKLQRFKPGGSSEKCPQSWLQLPGRGHELLQQVQPALGQGLKQLQAKR